jgi:hypothetical protein
LNPRVGFVVPFMVDVGRFFKFITTVLKKLENLMGVYNCHSHKLLEKQ